MLNDLGTKLLSFIQIVLNVNFGIRYTKFTVLNAREYAITEMACMAFFGGCPRRNYAGHGL